MATKHYHDRVRSPSNGHYTDLVCASSSEEAPWMHAPCSCLLHAKGSYSLSWLPSDYRADSVHRAVRALPNYRSDTAKGFCFRARTLVASYCTRRCGLSVKRHCLQVRLAVEFVITVCKGQATYAMHVTGTMAAAESNHAYSDLA
ncbi:hypothetical protein BAUCODRAFT_257110 [Baudoinia panamericana UAMH 10762]|uniref:Uncharacterized protein n=1 Tax=Baudoinia panamericana (strain UAMH 10762) TaxID=717646 RepID=M2N1W2_BAUPA|nr:uncharacterized protein BAUCODRAFT_257110 [Baudoinia panamericana UAMH 10762]EMC92655.1 hypothetical protein BAUCODRAFT_257110 [Baudoinia panamericana UAMH 10762]